MKFNSRLTSRVGSGLRLTIAAVLAVPLTIGALSQPAVATGGTFFPKTSFEIDGNPAGPLDFLAPYGPGTTLAPPVGGYPTTGLYYNQRTVDKGGVSGCNIAQDDIALGGSFKVEDGPAWPVNPDFTPAPNGKTDLDSIDVAAEKVNVNGTINDILYLGYQMCDLTPNSTWQAAVAIDDGDGVSKSEGDLNGDFLFIFDFNPSAGTVTIYKSVVSGGAYQPLVAVDGTDAQGAASGPYGEIALNLTALTIVGGTGSSECDTVELGGRVASLTGGSLTSSMKDLLGIPPLTISNCGAVNVQKVSQPANTESTTPFDYVLNQADSKPSHDSTLSNSGVVSPGATTEPLPATAVGYQSVNASIGIDDTHGWTSVIASTDYRLDETTAPAGWQRVGIVCNYVDIFAAGMPMADPPATAGTTGFTTNFAIPPSVIQTNAGIQNITPTSCVMTNSTSGIVVEKIGAGTQRDFSFTVNGSTVVVPLNGQSAVIPFTPGTPVTIIETLPTADPAVPAWTFGGAACNNAGATTSATPSIGVTTVGGSVIKCTFTNNQLARINVTKVTDPATSLDEFDFTVTGRPNIIDLSNGETGTTGDIAPGSYTITELVTAATPAWDLTNIDCGTPNLATDSTVVTVAAGQTVNCTFTNRQMGSLRVVKTAIGGNDTFSFTGAVTGNITTVGGTGSLPAVGSPAQQVTPGSYSIDENVAATPGYTLTSATCDDGTTRTLLTNRVDPTVSAGEQVTCTFVNTRNTGTFTLVKNWGDATAGNTVRLHAGVTGTGPLASNVQATSTAAADGTSVQIATASGQTVSFGEDTFANGAAYNTSLSCVQTGTTTPVTAGLTVGDLNRSGTYTVGNTPLNVTCTLDNTLKTAGVFLQKAWADPAGGATASITAAVPARSVTNSDTSVSPALPVINADEALDNSAFVPVLIGDVVTFTESLGAQAANYTTSFACQDAVNSPVKVNDYQYTLAIAAGDAGKQPICTFTNTRRTVNVIVAKDWNNAIAGNAVTIGASGSATPISFGAIAEGSETDTSGTFTVYAGETLTFTETWTTGDAAAYTTTFSCTGADTATDGTLSIPTTGGTITCTYVNSRRSVTLTLDKAWVNSVAGDTAQLTAAGVDVDAATSTAPAGATAGNTAQITAYAGETITLSEIITSATASYASALDCGAEPITYTPGATTGTIAISPAQTDGPAINCTFTNRARRGTIVINKSVVGVSNGTFNFTGTWLSPTGFSITTTDPGKTGSKTSLGVLIGNYNVAELAPTPEFDGSTLVCTGDQPNDTSTGDTSQPLNGTIDLDDGETVTCSFTNTQRAKIVIDKVTVPAGSAESFAFTSSYGAGFNLTDAATPNDSGWIAPNVAYTVNETAETGWDLTSIVCSSNIAGSNNAGSKTVGQLSVTPAPGEVVSCVYTNTQRASIVIDKVTIPANDPQAFAFEANWDGNLDAPADFSLTHAGTPVSSGFIIPGVPYTVTEASLGGWTLTDLVCTGDNATENVGGRSAVITPAPGETVTCTYTNTKRGAAGVLKTLDSDYAAGATQVTPVNPLAPNVFQVEYDLTVTTTSFANEDFVIQDKFNFGSGTTINTWTINRTSATGPLPSATWNGGAGPLADNLVAVTGTITPGAIYTYHVIVTFTVDPAMTLPARDCDPLTSPGGTGTLNTATAITGTIEVESSACAEIPGPAITVTKTVAVTNPAQPLHLGGFNYSVAYNVVVTNAGNGPGSYTLADMPNFGAGVTNVAVTSVPDLPVGAVGIEAAGSDTYLVTVTFTVPPTMTLAERECATEPVGGQGTYNSVTVTSQSGVDTGEDCVDIPDPSITVTKTATSDTATFLGNEVYSVSYDVVVTNSGGGPGQYTLNDQPDFADNVTVLTTTGLPAGPVGIEAGGVDNYTVTVTFSITGALSAAAAECADGPGGINQGAYNLITVTSQSGSDTGEDCANIPTFDLELIKADGGATGVAGGDPFTYTISVRNVGERDADASDPVTVTDTLPAGLVWVTVPTNCVVAGQVVTCDLDPTLLGVGDPAVVITATVRAPADTAAGTYTNVAVVTTEDDPVCVGTGCVPPPCPATGNNNVDCEETPVVRASDIQIVKTDNVADGATVAPGQSFSYSLVVTNLGPSTILPGITVSDDLPAQLTLVSVTGGTGWTCNNVDPVSCTYGPSLAAGAAASAITVVVQVSSDASGSSVVNVATATGTSDGTTPLTDTDDETTPLALSADLAIIKTSSVEVVGEGGTFDWILNVTNNGPGAASKVVINDTVPGEVTITSVSSSAFVCSNVGNELTCTRTSLAVGASGTITIRVQVRAGNTATSTVNVGRVNSETPDPDPTNNFDDDSVTLVVSQPPVVQPPPTPDLPATGSNITGVVTTAMWLLLIGGSMILITRRRRRQPTA